jgi:protein-S-isoprenylcysteine O-methyltransferase Ste14
MTTDALAWLAIAALWILWLGYWIAVARDVKRTHWREPSRTRVLHATPLVLCAALLMAPRWLLPPLTARFAPTGSALPLLGTAMVAGGLGFTLWARRHLGRNWSGWVTVKEDHALIRTGPYRVVRHPIYSGLLLGLAGTALAIGEWRGLLAVAFAVVAFVLKLRIEEARMRETFPEYEQYRRQVAALIPGLF